MEAHGLLLASLVVCGIVETCYGSVQFSSLKRTLDVTASPNFVSKSYLEICTSSIYNPLLSFKYKCFGMGILIVKNEAVLRAGVDKISVTWALNNMVSTSTDSTYKTVKVKLCYAPVSQRDRAWRKTDDDLSRDKTCQHNIVAKPYDNKSVQRFEWVVERDVPTATFFVRAYAYDSNGVEVGYGQTTDVEKTTNLFEIDSISGRHASLDICSVCFSAFSVMSLIVFFYVEKRKGISSFVQNK